MSLFLSESEVACYSCKMDYMHVPLNRRNHSRTHKRNITIIIIIIGIIIIVIIIIIIIIIIHSYSERVYFSKINRHIFFSLVYLFGGITLIVNFHHIYGTTTITVQKA